MFLNTKNGFPPPKKKTIYILYIYISSIQGASQNIQILRWCLSFPTISRLLYSGYILFTPQTWDDFQPSHGNPPPFPNNFTSPLASASRRLKSSSASFLGEKKTTAASKMCLLVGWLVVGWLVVSCCLLVGCWWLLVVGGGNLPMPSDLLKLKLPKPRGNATSPLS